MKNETIIDRVVERLKAQPLGDLITEEDLHEIVKAAIPKVFFEGGKVNRGSDYQPRWETSPAPLLVILQEVMKPALEKAMTKWVEDNQLVVAETMAKILEAGVIEWVQKVQTAKANTLLAAGFRPMIDMLNQERSRMGLPALFLPGM